MFRSLDIGTVYTQCTGKDEEAFGLEGGRVARGLRA